MVLPNFFQLGTGFPDHLYTLSSCIISSKNGSQLLFILSVKLPFNSLVLFYVSSLGIYLSLSLFSFFWEMSAYQWSAINFLVDLYLLPLNLLSKSFVLFFKKDVFCSFSEASGENIVLKCIHWDHQKCKGQWLRLNLQGFALPLLMCKPDDSLYVTSHSLLIYASTMLCMTTSIHLENSITWCGGPFNTKNNGQLISQIKIIKSHNLHADHPHASVHICH